MKDNKLETLRAKVAMELHTMTREELESFSQIARGKVGSSIDALLDKALELKSK